MLLLLNLKFRRRDTCLEVAKPGSRKFDGLPKTLGGVTLSGSSLRRLHDNAQGVYSARSQTLVWFRVFQLYLPVTRQLGTHAQGEASLALEAQPPSLYFLHALLWSLFELLGVLG